jgi:molybdopterin-guanine dinucleotide biosynthesis protein B
MRIVAAVGLSETGKTLLLSGLISEFKRRGLQTFAVKHCAHGFMLDTEGKDTWQYAQAGADGVAMVSSEEYAILQRARDIDLRSLAERAFAGADIVLVEGGKQARGLRKIEVLRSGISDVVQTPPGELLAVVSDGGAPQDTTVPVFSFSQTQEICDLILSQEEEAMSDVKLEVDGKEIVLNPFVRTFIEKTVLGMVTSLSGVDPEPRKIIVAIDRKVPKGKTQAEKMREDIWEFEKKTAKQKAKPED